MSQSYDGRALVWHMPESVIPTREHGQVFTESALTYVNPRPARFLTTFKHLDGRIWVVSIDKLPPDAGRPPDFTDECWLTRCKSDGCLEYSWLSHIVGRARAVAMRFANLAARPYGILTACATGTTSHPRVGDIGLVTFHGTDLRGAWHSGQRLLGRYCRESGVIEVLPTVLEIAPILASIAGGYGSDPVPLPGLGIVPSDAHEEQVWQRIRDGAQRTIFRYVQTISQTTVPIQRDEVERTRVVDVMPQ